MLIDAVHQGPIQVEHEGGVSGFRHVTASCLMDSKRPGQASGPQILRPGSYLTRSQPAQLTVWLAVSSFSTISTRRFACRPAEVAFDATGLAEPMPRIVIRRGSAP